MPPELRPLDYLDTLAWEFASANYEGSPCEQCAIDSWRAGFLAAYDHIAAQLRQRRIAEGKWHVN